jgi:hypothetical protein
MTVTRNSTWHITCNGGGAVIDPRNGTLTIKGFPKLVSLYAAFKEAYREDGELIQHVFPMNFIGQGIFHFNEEFKVYFSHRLREGLLYGPNATQIRLVSGVDLDGTKLYINGYEAPLHDCYTRLPEYMSTNILLNFVAIRGSEFQSWTQEITNYQTELVFPVHFGDPKDFDMVDTLGIL